MALALIAALTLLPLAILLVDTGRRRAAGKRPGAGVAHIVALDAPVRRSAPAPERAPLPARVPVTPGRRLPTVNGRQAVFGAPRAA